MWIARKIEKGEHKLLDMSYYRWWWLAGGVALGMSLTGLMAWNGGILKLYNDIPSLVGYLSVMLLIYKIGVGVVNRFFKWASGFGYELYLVHSLAFAVMTFFLKGTLPLSALLPASLVAAYAVGYCYHRILKTCRLK